MEIIPISINTSNFYFNADFFYYCKFYKLIAFLYCHFFKQEWKENFSYDMYNLFCNQYRQTKFKIILWKFTYKHNLSIQKKNELKEQNQNCNNFRNVFCFVRKSIFLSRTSIQINNKICINIQENLFSYIMNSKTFHSLSLFGKKICVVCS